MGETVGAEVVGLKLGSTVGAEFVGSKVGSTVGAEVDGSEVGFTEGCRIGSTVGWVYSWIYGWICCWFDGLISAGSRVTVIKKRSYIFQNYFVLLNIEFKQKNTCWCCC